MSEQRGEQGGAAVGRSMDRIDSRLKVTGSARYAAEFDVPNMVHAVLIQSAIDAAVCRAEGGEALAASGVLAIIA
jgi:xanthine dehydrogenase YagR molybdenum-binding subunit